MPKQQCGPGCDGRDCATRKKLAAWAAEEGGVTLLKRKEEETPMGKRPLTYAEALRKRQAGEPGAFERLANELIKEAARTPAPAKPRPATAPLSYEVFYGVIQKRAVELNPKATPEAAMDQYVQTPEGARCYEVLTTLPHEQVRPEAVEKGVVHANSEKARAERRIFDEAERLMREEYEAAHREGRFSGLTREMAVAEVVRRNPRLYDEYVRASDEPTER